MKKILFALLATVSLKGFEKPQEKCVPSSIMRAAVFLNTCEKMPQKTKDTIDYLTTLLDTDQRVPSVSLQKSAFYTVTCGYCHLDLGTDPIDAFYHLRPNQASHVPVCPIRHPLIAKQQKIRRQHIVPQLFSPDSLYCDEET